MMNYKRQPEIPKVLRVIDGRVRLAGDKTGRKTRAYLRDWGRAVKLSKDVPVTMIRSDAYEQIRALALLGENYGA